MTNTTADIAAALETTPRTLRKFLRSDASGIEAVGKGARYALPTTKRDIAKLTKNFIAWSEAQEEARKARTTAPDAPEAEIDDDATPSLDEMNCPLDD